MNLTLGICMDLNARPPVEWTSIDGPYELADHCVKNKTNILVLLNAWLDSGIQEDDDLIAEETEDRDGEKGGEEESQVEMTGPDWRTLNFWTARLLPLWRRRRGSTHPITSQTSDSDLGERPGVTRENEDEVSHETLVVVCNRTGEENGKLLLYLQRIICIDLGFPGKTFAGSSALFSMRAGSGRARLLHTLGRREECVRIWELPV